MKKTTSLKSAKTPAKKRANHNAATPKSAKPEPKPIPEPKPPQPEVQTRVKGDHQPPTKIGLDDERSKTGNKDEPREDKGSITDQVMADQAKYHMVQRT